MVRRTARRSVPATFRPHRGHQVVRERVRRIGKHKKHKRQRAPARWRLVLKNACRCSVELGRGLLKGVRQGDTPLAITRALSTRSLPRESHTLPARPGRFPRLKGRAKPSRGKDDQDLKRDSMRVVPHAMNTAKRRRVNASEPRNPCSAAVPRGWAVIFDKDLSKAPACCSFTHSRPSDRVHYATSAGPISTRKMSQAKESFFTAEDEGRGKKRNAKTQRGKDAEEGS